MWSLALARHTPSGHPAVVTLRGLIEDGEEVVLLPIILQELLQALRIPTDRERLAGVLGPFETPLVSVEDHREAAELFLRCRGKGIQLATVDALIMAQTLRARAVLLTVDEDFVRSAPITGLKLLPV